MNGFDLSTISDCYIGSTQASAIYLGSNLVWPKTQHDYSKDYLTIRPITDLLDLEISFSNNNIQYSIDNGSTWNTLTPGNRLTVPTYGKAMFKASGLTPVDRVGIGTFAVNTGFDVEGNIMSLVYGDNFANATTIPNNYQFCELFMSQWVRNANNLILPATTLTTQCYDSMFSYCPYLISVPELPATVLANACYVDMFEHCNSLTTAPELPATTTESWCYSHMFNGCTSLTTAPDLPATTLAQGCYNYMFYGCTSLNSVKCLATNISAQNCTTNWVDGVAASGTFTKATSMTDWTTGVNGIPSGWTVQNYSPHDYSQDYLTFEIVWSGTTIGFSTNDIQYSLDNGSTWNTLIAGTSTSALNQDDKVLFKASGLTPTSTLGIGTFSVTNGSVNVYGNIMSMAYGDNFVGMTTIADYQFLKLFSANTNIIDASNLILPATTLTTYCYSDLFNGATNLTAAPELPATTLATYCYNKMFKNCSSLTAAPELPVTTLERSCYYQMFYGCTSLTTAPDLPATTLKTDCYKEMFNGCTLLNYIKCLANGISGIYCSSWVKNVAASGTFVKNPNMTSWNTGVSGVPSGWTVQDAS